MNIQTLILTDNPHALTLAHELRERHGDIDIFQSPDGPLPDAPRLDVRTQWEQAATYGLVLSIHCKQLFPPGLVNGTRCVNVHPGLNPHNRGWFPQVFSILNGLPAGVTIHEIDEQLDHGPVIAQREYRIEPWDTSGSAYDKLMELERDLVLEQFTAIRDRTYTATVPAEGNVNFKRDFNRLREIDLSETGSFGDFLNRLRALTHGDFRNAYFFDNFGRKVFVRVTLEPES